MSQTIPHNAYVIVADGTRAIAFENICEKGDPELRKLENLEPSNLLNDGPAGKRPPESDQQETDEATFAKQIAEHLNKLALEDTFQHLVLIADPQTLGQIRPILHLESEKRLIKTVNKTLTNSPIEDIEKALA